MGRFRCGPGAAAGGGEAGPVAAVLILISACLYGGSPILAKIAYAYGVTPLTLLTWRTTLAAAMFWTALAVLRRPLQLARPFGGLVIALGLTFVPIQVFSYFFALSQLPASTAAVVVNTSSVHVAWMERLLLHERLAPGELVILAAIVAGALLVAGQTPSGGTVLGFVALGTATFASAFYLVTQRRLVRDVPPLTVMAVIQICSACVYWTAGLASGQAGRIPPQPAMAAIVASTVLPSLASLLVLIALRTLAATRTAMLGMFEPVVTVVLSVTLLGDSMTFLRGLGIAAVLAGITTFYLRLRQSGIARPTGATANS